MADFGQKTKARGAASNPKNRFEKLEYIETFDDRTAEEIAEADVRRTEFLRDDSQSIITYNNSPDIPFSASLNPYRGCEHGCAYCYARPTHEYLGFSAGLDFESRIVVKENAPELLRKELSAKKWKPQVLAMSGVTDCYQPVERKLEITRRCLGVLAEFRQPVAIVTKNHLVTRDIDHLSELARFQAVAVSLSITSLDPELTKRLEPRASPPSRRLAAVRELSQAGIPVRVLFAPVIPGLTDHEIPAVVEAAREAGAIDAFMVVVRLPLGVGPLFEEWLGRFYPERKEKVLHLIRGMRGGKLNDPRFGHRMEPEGVYADQLQQLWTVAMKRARFPNHERYSLSTAHFRKPSAQLSLFE